MESSCGKNRKKFEKPVISLQEADIPKAIDDQHAKNSRREKFPKILDEIRRFAVFTKYEEREKTCRHRSYDAQADGDHLLQKCHLTLNLQSR